MKSVRRTRMTLFIAAAWMLSPFMSVAQHRQLKPSVSTGFLTGGRATSSTFYFRGGIGAYAQFNWISAESPIYPSLSIGVEKLTEETLLPLGLEYAIRFSTQPNTGFLMIGGGYAFSFHESYENIPGYEYYGGVFFNPGWGFKWLLKNGSELFVNARYRHQFLKAEFEADGVSEYTERFQYMLLQLTTGIIF